MIIIPILIPSQKFHGRLSRRARADDFALRAGVCWGIVSLLGTLVQIVAAELGYLDLLEQTVTVPTWSPWFAGAQVLLFKLWFGILIGVPLPLYLAAYALKRMLSR